MEINTESPVISIIGGSFETGNLGVSALTAGAVKCALTRWPDARVFLLDYSKAPGTYDLRLEHRRVPVELVNIRFSKRVLLPNNIAVLLACALLLKIPSKTLRHRLLKGNHWLRSIWEADIVASIAGGDSFSDIYGMGRLLYVSLPQILSIWLGKKLVLLPQTFGPFRRTAAKVLAGYILNNADTVYSRDEDGVKAVSAALRPGDDAKVRFSYDLGFVLDPARPLTGHIAGLPAEKPRDQVWCGLNVSGLLLMGGYTRTNMFGLIAAYEEFVCAVIDLLITRKDASVLLVPHVFGDSAESDVAACEAIYEKLRSRHPARLGVVRGQHDQSEIKFVIGQCDFFVGSRMHACIAATSQAIPTISVAYSDKFIGVMKSVGAEELVADARKMTEEQLLGAIDTSFDRRDEIREKLQRRMPEVKRRILALFGERREIVREEVAAACAPQTAS